MSILLPRIFDAHTHFRQDNLLRFIAPDTDRWASYALIMPNLRTPLVNAELLAHYRADVVSCLHRCRPLFTFFVSPSMTPADVRACKGIEDVIAGKIYPDGVTTGSRGSRLTADIFRRNPCGSMHDILAAMQDEELALCLHGEMPGVSCLDAEEAFLDWVRMVLDEFPRLRVVLEHISTAAASSLVTEEAGKHQRLACTITLHHLLMTIDDVVGNAHHFCKPVCKRDTDRAALIRLIKSGCCQVMFGSDSAPHPLEKKNQVTYSEHVDGEFWPVPCCAGVYSAPIVPEAIYEVLWGNGVAYDVIHRFLAGNACCFYRLPEPTETLNLRTNAWRVRHTEGWTVSFLAGRMISYRASGQDEPSPYWLEEIDDARNRGADSSVSHGGSV